jgi:hypothetical protein
LTCFTSVKEEELAPPLAGAGAAPSLVPRGYNQDDDGVIFFDDDE